eukprot:scaffold43040_cov43-Phaeocystis_antarctica.AAC.1
MAAAASSSCTAASLAATALAAPAFSSAAFAAAAPLAAPALSAASCSAVYPPLLLLWFGAARDAARDGLLAVGGVAPPAAAAAAPAAPGLFPALPPWLDPPPGLPPDCLISGEAAARLGAAPPWPIACWRSPAQGPSDGPSWERRRRAEGGRARTGAERLQPAPPA